MRFIPTHTSLRARILADLVLLSGPLGADAREIATRLGESTEDVQAELALLVEAGMVRPCVEPDDQKP